MIEGIVFALIMGAIGRHFCRRGRPQKRRF